MNRRNFLSLFSAGVAGIALKEAIPLGRVWSFPKKIVIARPELTIDELGGFRDLLAIGDIVTIKQALGFPGYLGPFIITDVCESAVGLMFQLKAPRHDINGMAPGSALEPILTGDVRRDSSRTPS